MSSERLLKKIRRWAKSDREVATNIDYEEFKRSVLSDVVILYNTQKGTALIDNELGVPDFCGLMNRFGEQEVSLIERSLRSVTEKFEPRMSNTIVNYAPREDDYGAIRFNITTNLDYKNKKLPLEFIVLVNGNGSVSIDI